MPRPEDRDALQQPVVRLRRLLPPQGHQAAAGQLRGRAPEHDERHRGEQPHAQGLHRGPGTEDGRGARVRRRLGSVKGEGRGHRGVPPDDEVRQRQLPPEQHPGRDEAHQGQGRHHHHLRAYPRGRQHVLRQQGRQRPGGVQAPLAGHHRQPLRPMPGRREDQGLHPRHLPPGLTGKVLSEVVFYSARNNLPLHQFR